MARLSSKGGGKFEIQFRRPDGGHTAIRLAAVSRRYAGRVRSFVEDLVVSRETGRPPGPATTKWVARAPGTIRRHLEWLGLAAAPAPTLAEWLQTYIDKRGYMKPKSVLHYQWVMRDVLDFFGGQTRIDSVAAGQAEDFRIWLKSKRRLAGATASMHCCRAKQFFESAVKSSLIAVNPFAHIRCGAIANPKRLYFVTREDAEAVLNACPTAEWRLIFALCRYGGLRCPSEIIRLRWKDVDWVRRRFTVHAPKVEPYGDTGVRHVPIFPELYPHLRAVFEQVKEDSEYVITRYRRPDQNLGTYLRDIIRRAGLKPWPRLTQNLRSTRETELAEDFPLHVACAWIGNTREIAKTYYLQVTESQYKRAADSPATPPATAKTPSVLPADLVRGWAHLPKHIREAILTLVSMAS